MSTPHPPPHTMTAFPPDLAGNSIPPLPTFPKSGPASRSSSPSPIRRGVGSSSSGPPSPNQKSRQLLGGDLISIGGGIGSTGTMGTMGTGKESPRSHSRRSSFSSSFGSERTGSLTPLSEARRLLKPDSGSPSVAPHLAHGSFLHHEHSTPDSDVISGSINTGGEGGGGGGAGGQGSSSAVSLVNSRRNSLNGSDLEKLVGPVGPGLAESKVPMTAARRGSKPFCLSGSNAAFQHFLSSHTVADMVGIIPSQEELIEIDGSTSPADAFEILLKSKILAAPVWDSISKSYTGFISLKDCLSTLIFAYDEASLQVAWSETWSDVMKSKFGPTTSLTYLSRRNPFKPVQLDSALLNVAKVLSNQLHRVPVVDPITGKCISIVSQSAMVQYLIKSGGNEIKEEWKQSLGSLQLGLCKVISLTTDQSAYQAFKLLEVSQVSGIAVVDKEGKLVGNTSARDLKLFVLDRGSLSLEMPILEFLSCIRQREQINECHPSCSVGVSTSLAHVVGLMAATKYHRIFIVDAHARPIGVVSVTDILRFATADLVGSNNFIHSNSGNQPMSASCSSASTPRPLSSPSPTMSPS